MTQTIPPKVEVIPPSVIDRAHIAEQGHRLLGLLGGSKFIRDANVQVYDRLTGISIKTGDWWRDEPCVVDISVNPDGTLRIKAMKANKGRMEIVAYEMAVPPNELAAAFARVTRSQ